MAPGAAERFDEGAGGRPREQPRCRTVEDGAERDVRGQGEGDSQVRKQPIPDSTGRPAGRARNIPAKVFNVGGCGGELCILLHRVRQRVVRPRLSMWVTAAKAVWNRAAGEKAKSLCST